MSQALRCRPSSLYGLNDPVVAYCFDSAVARWGVSFEAAVQQAVKGKTDERQAEQAQMRVVRKWLRLPLGYGR